MTTLRQALFRVKTAENIAINVGLSFLVIVRSQTFHVCQELLTNSLLRRGREEITKKPRRM
jgi:hypothetical protein